jgi:hypothetical protein
MLEEIGDRANLASQQWEAACDAFQRSIDLLPGSNVEALLAFGERLLKHAATSVSPAQSRNPTSLNDVTYALSLLDDAEEAAQQHSNPDPEWENTIASCRARGLELLNETGGLAYARRLQNSNTPALGYYCEARLALRNPDSPNDIGRAIAVLKDAEAKGIDLGPRGISFRLFLARKNESEQFDFDLLVRLHQRLEAVLGGSYRTIDRFRHAVLCYQREQFQEGAERFRRLREQARAAGAIPLRVREVWRNSGEPTKPRLASVRVTRINTLWDGDGYVDAIRQSVPLRPRHFDPPAKLNEVRECVIRFQFSGPIAVPPRFEQAEPTKRGRVQPRAH